MAILSINGHIDYHLAEYEKLMDIAATFEGWKFDIPSSQEQTDFIQRFSAYTHGKLITQYCQERLIMLHRYDVKGMVWPAEAYQYSKARIAFVEDRTDEYLREVCNVKIKKEAI
jgi:hypothetical protein